MYCQGWRETSSQHKNECIKWTESTDQLQGTVVFLISPNFKSLWFQPSFSHVYAGYKKNKGQRRCGQKQHPCFCTGNAGHQLAKDSLSWNNWKRRQNLRASQAAWVGEGFPSGPPCKWRAAATSWPLRLKAHNLQPQARLLLCFSTTQALKASPLSSFLPA